MDRLDDVIGAVAAISAHLARGGLDDGLVYDAVRVRLIEIGEAVKALSTDLTATEPQIPWKDIARLRDHLAHRYFDTERAIVRDTVLHDVPDLGAAVLRMRQRAEADGPA